VTGLSAGRVAGCSTSAICAFTPTISRAACATSSGSQSAVTTHFAKSNRVGSSTAVSANRKRS